MWTGSAIQDEKLENFAPWKYMPLSHTKDHRQVTEMGRKKILREMSSKSAVWLSKSWASAWRFQIQVVVLGPLARVRSKCPGLAHFSKEVGTGLLSTTALNSLAPAPEDWLSLNHSFFAKQSLCGKAESRALLTLKVEVLIRRRVGTAHQPQIRTIQPIHPRNQSRKLTRRPRIQQMLPTARER